MVFAVLYIFLAIFMFMITITSSKVNLLIILFIVILSIINCSVLVMIASRNNGCYAIFTPFDAKGYDKRP